MTRSICVVTGTRAEYGLLEPLISRIASDRSLTLELIVTGTHVSPEFGMTVKAIENDGYSIARKIEMLVSSDSDVGVAKSVGLGIIGFADALQELQPDVLVVLGDRFEMLAITSTAMLMHIPILHIHGGELTAGALDDSIRHAITKMANVHCVATDEYRRRVVQLGEHCNSVFCVGGLGVDAIKKTNLLTRKELEGRIGFVFKDRNLLVSLHPETMIKGDFEHQIAELFAALASKPDIGLIFSLSNADAGGRAVTKKIEEFVRTNPSAITIPSLGQQCYLSCINECDGLIGNSSSGLLEAPSFRKGSINLGCRQEGRTRAASVLDCGFDRHEICIAIDKLFSPAFEAELGLVVNPYDQGGAADKVIEILKNTDFQRSLQKRFSDVDFNLPVDFKMYE